MSYMIGMSTCSMMEQVPPIYEYGCDNLYSDCSHRAMIIIIVSIKSNNMHIVMIINVDIMDVMM